jgi:hypothetical protein
MRATNWSNRWRGGGVAALLLGALLLTLLTSENPLPARDDAKPAALPSDLAAIPEDSTLLLSGRVADQWNSELSKAVRQKLGKDLVEAIREFENKFGMRPEQVERFTMAILDPPPSREEPLLFLHTMKEYDRAKVIAAVPNAKEQKYKGHTLYVGDKQWAVYPLDGQSLVYGSPDGLHGLIDHPAPKMEGHLAGARRLAAGTHSFTAALNVKAFNDAVGDKLPGEAEPFKPLLQALSATLTVDLAEQSRAAVRLTFANEKDAKAALKPAQGGLNLSRLALDQGISQLSKQKEMTKIIELLKQAQAALKDTAIEQQGATLQASASLKIDVATVGMTLLEAVQKVREAASRTQAQNNLKQIALAMHNYHDTIGRFPPQATYDKNGKPMLSWRVMILPYIEQQNLYNQFHLDEPWDSEHNKKLLAKMPTVYASPSDEKSHKDHTTHYQGFVGKGAFFEGKKGIGIADIPDGTSNTIMIVEASKAVPWSKPEDLPYDPAKELPKLGLPGAKGFLASLCDGSVRFFSPTIKPMTLRNLITRNDGNPIDSNDF